MVLNFPTGATLNQVYTSGGISWKWNGYAWDAYNEYNLIRRFAVSGSNLYCGVAPVTTTGVATTESDLVWTITRLTTSSDGSVTSTATAQPVGGVNWINFNSHTYS